MHVTNHCTPEEALAATPEWEILYSAMNKTPLTGGGALFFTELGVKLKVERAIGCFPPPTGPPTSLTPCF